MHSYDSQALAGIDLSLKATDAIHQQFVNGGIRRAVERLLELESHRSPVVILGFSVGGTIAWQAVAAGLRCRFFYALSATRLRYETTPLDVPGRLVYGTEDPYRPSAAWLNAQTRLETSLLPGEVHDFYSQTSPAQRLVAELVRWKQSVNES